MAKLRRFSAYRRLERPYTRRSKFRRKAFIKVNPNVGIVRFVMGDTTQKPYPMTLLLRSKQSIQLRNFAVESGRQCGNRVLEKNVGKTGYRMVVRVFPHHVLRENPLASGAGADRMSTGMQAAFGKPIGLAAQVHENAVICQVDCQKQHLDFAKKALRRFSSKLPGKTYIEMYDNERKAKL